MRWQGCADVYKRQEYYVRQHQDNIVIAKLKTNKPLTETDVKTLESILWSEVGTREEYEHEYGQKPLGEFVRGIVGLSLIHISSTGIASLIRTQMQISSLLYLPIRLSRAALIMTLYLQTF